MPRRQALTLAGLKLGASEFAKIVRVTAIKELFGVTDGKAVGTWLEHHFRAHLQRMFTFEPGSSASGIDFPDLGVDVKTTSIRQPQSSCPFKSARQKVFGLGYSLLVFIYEKSDDRRRRAGRLNIKHVVFVDAARTGDYQLTRGVLELLRARANKEELIALFSDRMLPADEIELGRIADRALAAPPEQGYLTISNALQWRLQYSRAIESAGSVQGLERIC